MEGNSYKTGSIKMEEAGVCSPPSSFPADYYISSAFALQEEFDFGQGDKSSCLGFMDLLGIQDMTPTLLEPGVESVNKNHQMTKTESPEVVNPPATPNSSSISSASSEAVNEEASALKTEDQEEEEEPINKTKKQLKAKKTNQKRQREPRFAFMTKSEVDHLEDGYRWRKYGQKAVKNSPFPRSYYRCTSPSCNVKKRVERSFSDPSIVVTTYEGQHTHPSPVMPRSMLGSSGHVHLSSAAAFGGAQMQGNHFSHYHNLFQQQSSFFNNVSSPLNFGNTFLQERRLCSTTPPGSGMLKDHGLLQDLVPSSYMLQEQ